MISNQIIDSFKMNNQFEMNKEEVFDIDNDQYIETPFNTLPVKIQKIILYGSENTEIAFNYVIGNSKNIQKKHAFEGVIPSMERRYHDTESLVVREDLAKRRAAILPAPPQPNT